MLHFSDRQLINWCQVLVFHSNLLVLFIGGHRKVGKNEPQGETGNLEGVNISCVICNNLVDKQEVNVLVITGRLYKNRNSLEKNNYYQNLLVSRR